MADVILFCIIILVGFVVWIQSESLFSALISCIVLIFIFDIKFYETLGVIKNKADNLDEIVEQMDEKLTDIEESLEKRFGDVKIQKEETPEGRTIIKIDVNKNEQVKNSDVIKEMQLEPEHIVDYIREAEWAELYKRNDEYRLKKPDGTEIKPTVFLVHSDGSLYVGKGRRVWRVGAD